MLLINKTTTLECDTTTHIRFRAVSKPTRLANKEPKAGKLHTSATRKDVGNIKCLVSPNVRDGPIEITGGRRCENFSMREYFF